MIVKTNSKGVKGLRASMYGKQALLVVKESY